jgi:hypothetical protein
VNHLVVVGDGRALVPVVVGGWRWSVGPRVGAGRGLFARLVACCLGWSLWISLSPLIDLWLMVGGDGREACVLCPVSGQTAVRSWRERRIIRRIWD